MSQVFFLFNSPTFQLSNSPTLPVINLGAFFRPPFPLFFAVAFPATKKELHSGRGALRKVETLVLRFQI